VEASPEPERQVMAKAEPRMRGFRQKDFAVFIRFVGSMSKEVKSVGVSRASSSLFQAPREYTFSSI
jgi:hypothetical protein